MYFEALPTAGIKFVASSHQLGKVEIRSSGGDQWTAHVEGTWELELEIDSDRVKTTKPHVMELRYADSAWRFTHFGVREDPGEEQK